MLRTVVLSLVLFVSLASPSLLRKSISRRQSEPTPCQAIEGFECKCSSYRVTCTSDRALPSQLNVLQNERQKYPSVELIISGEQEQTVYEYTFEPVQQLFKPDADTLEFRIKFEKFAALHLSSPGIFNRVFSDNLPATTRKVLSLEIYNPAAQPNDNVNLFANLNVDSLELYVLHPFRGTFQQLFNGANIKSLRLSGGDIRSDLSEPFTGNIGQLELAKQASQINAQNFPIYPAHELIINAFYVTDFNSDNPPNYSNLAELRVHSQESIPANAFRQYPNLRILSVSTEKEIDPHAFDGLNNLERLIIKDTKPSLEVLNSLPNLKEFETSLDKLDEREQCQLVEKLANGQVAVQALPGGRECTCASAYLDTASGRYACDASNCDQSSCAAIKNNYDAATRTFKTPSPIKRADGSDALRQREPKMYTSAFQISNQDREKAQQGVSLQQQPSGQEGEEQQQQESGGVTPANQGKKSRRTRPRTQTTTPTYDQQQNPDGQDQWQPDQQQPDQQQPYQQQPDQQQPYQQQADQQQPYQQYPYQPEPQEEPNQGEYGESTTPIEGENNEQGEGGNGDRQHGENIAGDASQADPNQSTDAMSDDATDNLPSSPSPKKGWSWLRILIIVGIVATIILIGLIAFIVRRKRAARGYNPAATSETVPPRA